MGKKKICCAECDECAGDLFKCKECQKHWHEACGGPDQSKKKSDKGKMCQQCYKENRNLADSDSSSSDESDEEEEDDEDDEEEEEDDDNETLSSDEKETPRQKRQRSKATTKESSSSDDDDDDDDETKSVATTISVGSQKEKPLKRSRGEELRKISNDVGWTFVMKDILQEMMRERRELITENCNLKAKNDALSIKLVQLVAEGASNDSKKPLS